MKRAICTSDSAHKVAGPRQERVSALGVAPRRLTLGATEAFLFLLAASIEPAPVPPDFQHLTLSRSRGWFPPGPLRPRATSVHREEFSTRSPGARLVGPGRGPWGPRSDRAPLARPVPGAASRATARRRAGKVSPRCGSRSPPPHQRAAAGCFRGRSGLSWFGCLWWAVTLGCRCRPRVPSPSRSPLVSEGPCGPG